MTEWYRRKSWTQADEQEFFSKLNRARAHGRPQYLRIQAMELLETKNKELLNAAEGLLNKVLSDYPDSRTEKSQVLNHLGEIYRMREDYPQALDYYSQSLAFEKVFPNVITPSYLDFSELVVKTSNQSLYEVAETLLETRLENQIFPVIKYKMCCLLSIIKDEKGDLEKAEYYRQLAEQNASAKTSGLRYHKYLGVVNKRDNWLDKLKAKH